MTNPIEDLQMFQDIHINLCGTCGSEREKVNYTELPDATKKDYTEVDGEYWLHCSTCDTYSAISGGFYDGTNEGKRLKFQNTPAQNNPCPCGSGSCDLLSNYSVA